MKIGISCYPTYGGSGTVATELGKNLAELGYEIHFISYALPYRLSGYYSNIFFHEVKVPEYPLFEYPPYALALATKMADIAINEKLDLIHVHYAIPHALSGVMAREMLRGKYPLKIITTLHGTDITLVGADPSFMGITQYSINESDAITTVSQFLKNETLRIFQPTVPIDVIYNFIKEPPGNLSDCKMLRNRIAPNGEPILLHLSNFRPVKRMLDTIDILDRVLREMPAKLVLIGDGPDRGNAEKKARDLGIENHVVFLGKQEDVYALLNLGDVFLMPSQTESFGLAALEAMCCGLPCITSNTGGLPELNLHGETGYTAPVGDVDTMSEYALKILKDPALKSKLGENARKIALTKFQAESIIPQYVGLYEKVLSQ